MSVTSRPMTPAEKHVLLVAVPFGMARSPSFSLSLLKSELRDAGVSSRIEYLTLKFAREIGFEFYEWLSYEGKRTVFLGEWVFFPAFWGPLSDGLAQEYWSKAFPATDGEPPEIPLDKLSTMIRRAQHKAGEMLDQFVAATDFSRYPMVGVSSTFQQNLASLALAKKIKARSPETVVVLGGANCDGELGLELLRRFDCLDVVFSGEADRSFPPFARQVLSGGSLDDFAGEPGVFVRDSVSGEPVVPSPMCTRVTDLDSLPAADFDEYFEQLEDAGLTDRAQVSVQFETSRGCWWGQKHQCTFCGLNGSSIVYRRKTPSKAAAEINSLRERYRGRLDLVRATDNILDMEYFSGMLPHLLTREDSPRIFYETKSNLTRQQIETLARNRVSLVQPGIESLSSEVLKLMRKGTTGLQNVRFLKWCSELGVTCSWIFLVGFPGETSESYDAQRDLIPKLFHLKAPQVCQTVVLDRFSPYFQDPEEFGLTDVRPFRLYSFIYRDESQDVERLSYYFTYAYADGRSLDYTAECRELIREWISQEKDGCSLVGYPDEDEMVIWDTRRMAAAQWTRLDAGFSRLLAATDDIATLRTIRESSVWGNSRLSEDGDIARALEVLVDRGFVIREGDRFLSVVVVGRGIRPPAVPAECVTLLSLRGCIDQPEPREAFL